MRKLILVMVLSLIVASTYGAIASDGGTRDAHAMLKDTNGNVIGTATFKEGGSGLVRIDVRVNGLTPGLHGIHIHEKGACSPSFAVAGSHYNPMGKKHGLDNPDGPHAGDLPDINVDENGAGYLSLMTDRFTISPGPATLLDGDGSALVIHAGPDDQVTDPAGNSGDRIACGVIVAGPSAEINR